MAEDGGGGEAVVTSRRSSIRSIEEERTREEVCVSRDLDPTRHTRRKSQELCIITCKGTLGDPAFNKSFRRILSGLNKLLNTGEERVRVRKVEPWNSVRVTFTIPGDAAQRLRALALGGDATLSRLGILSVQLDPDQVIRVGAGAIQIQQPAPPVVNPDSLPLPPSSTLPGLGGTSMSCLPGASLSGLSSVLGSGPLPGPSTILGGSSLAGPSSAGLSLPGPSGIVTGPSTSGLTSPLVAGPSSAGLTSPLMSGSSSSSLTSPLMAGSSSSSLTSPLMAGSSSSSLTSPVMAGSTSSGLTSPLMASSSSASLTSPLIASSSSAGLTSTLMAGSSLPGPLSTTPVLAGPSSSLAGPSTLPGPSAAPLLPPPSAQPRPPPPKVFPFHSMNQAANVMRAAEQPPQPNTRQVVSGYPPPPYPNKVEGQVVSPLLVNLLQDSPSSSTTNQSQPSLPPPPPPAPTPLQVRVKQEEGSAFVPVAGSNQGFGGGAFRRLPPPYPGRVKEEVTPPPREVVAPPQPTPVQEEKKPQESVHQESSSNSTSKRQYLINPLTGVLEPMSSEDEEEEKTEPIIDDELSLDKDSDMSSSCGLVSTSSGLAASCISSAQASTSASASCTNSNIIPVPTPPPVICLPEQPIPVPSSDLLPQHQPKEEKIKLRLKLDKEAVVSVSSDNVSSNPSPLQESHSSPGYKVEMYVKRSHEGNHVSNIGSIVTNQVQPSVPQINSSLTNNGVEVPRVPPLHISLRGRNAAVVKKDKKRDTKKARKVCGELKRTKSSKLVVSQPITVMPLSPPERSPERPEPVRSPSPVSPRNDPELSDDIVPIRNYPSEAEVASILRSVVPHTTHKLLDDSRIKRRESKKKMYPRLEYTGSKKGIKKGGSGSLLKSVVKTNSKEVRMMSAVNKAIHRRDSADSTLAGSGVFVNSALKQRSNSVPGSISNSTDEFRPKVNCVFGKTSMPSAVSDPSETSKVVVNMCVNTGGSPPSGDTASNTTAPGQKNQTDPTKRNNEGDDSGIESMDALSEKSPNQGESPQRSTGSSVGCKSVNVTCGESPKPDQSQTSQLSTKDDQLTTSDIVSGGGESPVPVRLTPALYTYSNPEKLERRGGAESLSPSSMSGDEEDHLSKSHPSPEVDEEYSGSTARRTNSNKSLLEQLLIDIPSEASSTTTNTPTSAINSNSSETTESTPNQSTSNQLSTRRSRPTRHKTWDSQTWQTNHIDSRQSTLRVSKRKCSESASEGKSEDLGSPVSNDKTKLPQPRNSNTPGEEVAEDDSNSGASGDMASNRSCMSPAPPLTSPRLRHTKPEHSEPPQLDKTGMSGATAIRREVSVVLTKISRRSSVRQQKSGVTTPGVTQSQKTEPSSPPVGPPDPRKDAGPAVSSPASTPHRRKTRSQASDSSNEEGGSGAKRRRMSKDMK